MAWPRNSRWLLVAIQASFPAFAGEAPSWLHRGLDIACRHPSASGEELAAMLSGSTYAGGEIIRARGQPAGWRRHFDLPGGARLHIETIQSGGFAFFPQRHGTRTASLLLREAPNARLVPYRYPRPDMTRMADLVRHGDAQGIVMVDLSLGGNDGGDWRSFADAARGAPQMLFVVSAGNDGRDIDADPVYPAAPDLDDVITVTSSEHTGALARGSNRGAVSVDLLVPAEGMAVSGFDGSETLASGSSYAVVRVSALAARWLAEHPDWRATQLMNAIFDRVLPPPPGASLCAGASTISKTTPARPGTSCPPADSSSPPSAFACSTAATDTVASMTTAPSIC